MGSAVPESQLVQVRVGLCPIVILRWSSKARSSLQIEFEMF